MEPVSASGFVGAFITALLVGLVVALVTYAILWLLSYVMDIEEGSRRQIAAIAGALMFLLSLLGYLT